MKMKSILIWLFFGLTLCVISSAGKKQVKGTRAREGGRLLGNEPELSEDQEYEEEEDEDENEGPHTVTCGASYTVMFANMDCWKQCKVLGGTPSNCKFTKTSTTCVCVGLPGLGSGSLTPKGLATFFNGHLNGTFHSTVNFFNKGRADTDADADDEEYDEDEEKEKQALTKVAQIRVQHN